MNEKQDPIREFIARQRGVVVTGAKDASVASPASHAGGEKQDPIHRLWQQRRGVVTTTAGADSTDDMQDTDDEESS